MYALEIQNLQKKFEGFSLDVSFSLSKGCVMGLIGTNGAGKSTTIKLVLDMLNKDGGMVKLFGKDHKEDLAAAKEDMGIVLDGMGFPVGFTPKYIGSLLKDIYKNWEQDTYCSLLEKFDIPYTKAWGELSTGMKMKLNLAVALSHRPKLLLLDEPTNGLDPFARDQVLELLTEFTRDEEHSVLISSHIVSDLERICDYVTFLDKGRVLVSDEKDALLARYGGLQLSAEEYAALGDLSPVHLRESHNGVEAILLREDLPAGVTPLPVTVEELFVAMVKEAREV